MTATRSPCPLKHRRAADFGRPPSPRFGQERQPVLYRDLSGRLRRAAPHARPDKARSAGRTEKARGCGRQVLAISASGSANSGAIAVLKGASRDHRRAARAPGRDVRPGPRRTSKNPDGPSLAFTTTVWSAFMEQTRRGLFDL
ncbi:DUF397 domain-containing protein [Actinomadura napierensis]|uniref:DUF397 domain-containing protein n=1 Tax=Actinomadura napierensis TaxID=267854 RepID=UPI00387EA974